MSANSPQQREGGTVAAWCVARDLGAMAKRLSGKYRETQATDSRERYRWPQRGQQVMERCGEDVMEWDPQNQL